MTIDTQDMLLSKAVDRVATDQEWAQLDALAAADPSLWHRLGELTRLQAQLSQALDAATATADHVELDIDRAQSHHNLHIRVRTWSGWAIAAVLALALLGGNLGVLSSATNTGQTAGLLSIDASPDEVLEQYRTVGTLDGRFVSELPTVMVDVRVNPETGQAEMFYLRRFLERVSVEGLYTADPQRQHVVPVLIPTRNTTTGPGRQF